MRLSKLKNYPENFLDEICDIWNIRFNHPDDIEETLDYLLKTRLTEFERKIIEKRFKEQKTLRAIGSDLSYSAEYIRLTINHIIRVLSKENNFVYLKYGKTYVESYKREERFNKFNRNSTIRELLLSINDLNLRNSFQVRIYTDRTIGDMIDLFIIHRNSKIEFRNKNDLEVIKRLFNLVNIKSMLNEI